MSDCVYLSVGGCMGVCVYVRWEDAWVTVCMRGGRMHG